MTTPTCPHAKAGICLQCQLESANTKAQFLSVVVHGAAIDIEELSGKAARPGSLEKSKWNDRVRQLRADAAGQLTAETAR